MESFCTYLLGQIWSTARDEFICILQHDEASQSVVGFAVNGMHSERHLSTYVEDESVYSEQIKIPNSSVTISTDLLMWVNCSDLCRYHTTVVNSAIRKELQTALADKFRWLSVSHHPNYHRSSSTAPRGPRGSKPWKVKVYCRELDQTFESMRAAGRAIGASHGQIRYAILCDRPVLGNYHFEIV